MACGYDMTARLGETLSFVIIYKKADDTPIDIAADTVTWTIDDVTFSSPSDEVTIGPEVGTIHFRLTTPQVDAYGATILPYTIKVIDSAVPAGQGDLILLDGLIQFE